MRLSVVAKQFGERIEGREIQRRRLDETPAGNGVERTGHIVRMSARLEESHVRMKRELDIREVMKNSTISESSLNRKEMGKLRQYQSMKDSQRCFIRLKKMGTHHMPGFCRSLFSNIPNEMLLLILRLPEIDSPAPEKTAKVVEQLFERETEGAGLFWPRFCVMHSQALLVK
jgi:hypothetical protein